MASARRLRRQRPKLARSCCRRSGRRLRVRLREPAVRLHSVVDLRRAEQGAGGDVTSGRARSMDQLGPLTATPSCTGRGSRAEPALEAGLQLRWSSCGALALLLTALAPGQGRAGADLRSGFAGPVERSWSFDSYTQPVARAVRSRRPLRKVVYGRRGQRGYSRTSGCAARCSATNLSRAASVLSSGSIGEPFSVKSDT